MMKLNVNGREHDIDADPDTPLLYVLRDHLALNGAKFGCGLGQCGARTVMVDGEAVLSSGRLTRVDEDRLLAEIREAHARIAPLLSASEQEGERLREPLERIYRRCAEIDIPGDTYPAHFSH